MKNNFLSPSGDIVAELIVRIRNILLWDNRPNYQFNQSWREAFFDVGISFFFSLIYNHIAIFRQSSHRAFLGHLSQSVILDKRCKIDAILHFFSTQGHDP